MKKLLGIVVLGLLIFTNVYAKSIKPGSGPLKLSEKTVKIFHTYLTLKLTQTVWEAQKLPGFSFLFQGNDEKPRYANHFHIRYGGDDPYIWVWWNNANTRADTRSSPGCEECKMFARGNKIVWKGGKKRISRKVTLDELKTILKELGFYDG